MTHLGWASVRGRSGEEKNGTYWVLCQACSKYLISVLFLFFKPHKTLLAQIDTDLIETKRIRVPTCDSIVLVYDGA